MYGFHAARPGSTLAAAACGLVAALAVTSGGPARAASRAAGSRDGGACQGTAQLAISTRHPVQLRAVSFKAGSSHVVGGSVVFYDFSYGDGTDDATAQPTAVHAYQRTGTFLVRLNIVTSCNTVISSPAYHVIVRDGLAPTVAVTYPKPNQTVHFGTLGLQLRGTASDPSGVGHVDIAIQILSVL
ncbi:MAG TPA: PKD domain-containing protein, partial [Solirubrobacteraceae bacterium]|nr:PKD domain-containing protein [Solirubrobacteraceae bacterium]